MTEHWIILKKKEEERNQSHNFLRVKQTFAQRPSHFQYTGKKTKLCAKHHGQITFHLSGRKLFGGHHPHRNKVRSSCDLYPT